jgi:type II secretory pathway pseudopilin PulG
MNFLKKQPGESIVEVLVAATLLVVVLSTAFISLNRAAQTSINVENRIAAINLAREGMEAVRNIRDTNWLKYSGNKREKWLCLDSVASPNECTPSSYLTISNGYYLVNFSETANRYYLSEVAGADELDIPNDSADRESFRLYFDSSNRFTHDDDFGANPATAFYRQIEIVVISDDVCGTDGCIEEKMVVTSRVGWIEGDSTKNVVLETHLFDFYQRDEY